MKRGSGNLGKISTMYLQWELIFKLRPKACHLDVSA